MAKRYDKEQLISDHKTAMYTKSEIAYKYGISKTRVVQITKDIEQTSKQIVTDILKTNQQLKDSTDSEVTAIQLAVTEIEAHKVRTFNTISKAQSIMNNKMEAEKENMSISDLKNIIDASDKASITLRVNPRFSNTPQIVNQQNNLGNIFSDIADQHESIYDSITND